MASLLDGIAFVTNLQGDGPLAFYQAGVDQIQTLSTDLVRQLQRSSLVELVAIERWATTRLEAPPALRASLELERIFIQETMDGLASGSWKHRRRTDRALLSELDAMKVSDRLVAQVAVNRAVDDSVRRWEDLLKSRSFVGGS